MGYTPAAVSDLEVAQDELDDADDEVTPLSSLSPAPAPGRHRSWGSTPTIWIALGEGAVVVSSVATDPAGNTDSDGTGFTLDTIFPDAPSIDSWATDTNITDDGVTYDNTLTVSVTGEPGGTPRLYVSGSHIESDGSAGYSWTEDAPGAYTVVTDELAHEFAGGLTATITDTAGNESDPSNAVTVAVDTVAPAKPVIVSVVEDTTITDDGVTSDNTLTLTVAGESGAVLTLFQDGQRDRTSLCHR